MSVGREAQSLRVGRERRLEAESDPRGGRVQLGVAELDAPPAVGGEGEGVRRGARLRVQRVHEGCGRLVGHAAEAEAEQPALLLGRQQRQRREAL